MNFEPLLAPAFANDREAVMDIMVQMGFHHVSPLDLEDGWSVTGYFDHRMFLVERTEKSVYIRVFNSLDEWLNSEVF